MKELDESLYWMELLVESGRIEKSKLSGLIRETDELMAIFYTIIRKSKK